MGSWSGPLDCEGQDVIHRQCQEAAGETILSSLNYFNLSLCTSAKLPLDESSRQLAAQDMELVLSYYCKTRNIRYSPEQGWTELLLVLASLQMSRADLFNCFYAMLAKYIPRYILLHSNSWQPAIILVRILFVCIKSFVFLLPETAKLTVGHFTCFASFSSTTTLVSAPSSTPSN